MGFLFYLEWKNPFPDDLIFWLGLSLTGLKYAGEFVLYYLFSGRYLTPLQFLNPILGFRYQKTEFAVNPMFTSDLNYMNFFLLLVVLWSLPFIWIGFGMSFRRAQHAGQSPYLSFLFFIPALNCLMMLALSCLSKSTKRPKFFQKINKKTIISLVGVFVGPAFVWVIVLRVLCIAIVLCAFVSGFMLWKEVFSKGFPNLNVPKWLPMIIVIGAIIISVYLLKKVLQKATALPLLKPAFISFIIILFALSGVGLTLFYVNMLEKYTNSFFLLFPFIGGFIQAFFMARKTDMTQKNIYISVTMTVVLLHLFLLIFALEGVFCLTTSFILLCPLFLAGCFFGLAAERLFTEKPPLSLYLLFVLLPLMEAPRLVPYQDIVISSMEIKAEPEQIWPNLINCAEDLPPVQDWIFKAGAAYPVRSSTRGVGVGATRHCEFSTGSLIQSVTVWQEPYHLAFHVEKQIDIMKELSFYDHVHAPHLKGYFRAVKGDFKLTKTDTGTTLLERRTWYEMDMRPSWYWGIYSHWLIHKVHLRVLKHIKQVSEKPNNISRT